MSWEIALCGNLRRGLLFADFQAVNLKPPRLFMATETTPSSPTFPFRCSYRKHSSFRPGRGSARMLKSRAGLSLSKCLENAREGPALFPCPAGARSNSQILCARPLDVIIENKLVWMRAHTYLRDLVRALVVHIGLNDVRREHVSRKQELAVCLQRIESLAERGQCRRDCGAFNRWQIIEVFVATWRAPGAC